MPYISQDRRPELRPEAGRAAVSVGELTYQLVLVTVDYMVNRGLSFGSLSEAIAALECAKLELYRRIATPYEDAKRAEHGDVFGRLEPQLPHQGDAYL